MGAVRGAGGALVFPSRSLARKRLQHADAIVLGVHERDIGADSRNIHGFAENRAAKSPFNSSGGVTQVPL